MLYIVDTLGQVVKHSQDHQFTARFIGTWDECIVFAMVMFCDAAENNLCC